MTMKITKEELKLLIRDTLDEVALCRNKDTGHFDDCEPGNVYSLTKKGAESAGVSAKYVGRGTMTKNRKLDSPYGANTSPTQQCGRMKISGEKKPKDRRCRDYKQRGRYGMKESEVDFDISSIRRFQMMTDSDGDDDLFISLNDLIDSLGSMSGKPNNILGKEKHDLVENRSELIKKCRFIGFRSQQEYFASLTQSLNILKQAQDGELGKKSK